MGRMIPTAHVANHECGRAGEHRQLCRLVGQVKTNQTDP